MLRVERSVDADGVTRLSLVGDLDFSIADALTRQFRELNKPGERARLDLSQLEFIDSSGVRTLVVAVDEARRDRWVLEVGRELAPQVERVIELLGVDEALWPQLANGSGDER